MLQDILQQKEVPLSQPFFSETAPPIPEQGQIVTVRQRRYVVSDIHAGILPPHQPASLPNPQHLLTLNAIEDDGRGETLQIIWELEPGAILREAIELPQPTSFDPPHHLDAFLHAVRWGAIASADVRTLQAPFRSGIDIEDYQLDPLVRALQMPRVNLLVADDVGLGKTVEAGLVTQELIVRSRVRTVLIVCPAGLQIHWRDQMQEKFGLEFRIVDSQCLRDLRRSRGIHVNPWSYFPRLITSIDYLKRDRPMRLLRERLPASDESTYPRRFDLLIIDEAHNVAPSGGGQYAVDSLRTQAIRALAPHFEHKLFLTATPHNGYPESFSALLELLDNQRFARGIMPSRHQLEAIMVRRLKSELTDWDGTPRFPQRRLQTIEVSYTPTEREIHRWLQEYTRSRQESADSHLAKFATEFVLKLLKKRLFSSPAAFAHTLAKHRRTLAGDEVASKRKQTPTAGILKRQLAQIEEEYADDDEYEDATAGATSSSTQLFAPLSARENWLLDQMATWGEAATGQGDKKLHALIAWLQAIVKPNGTWNNERVIIFTEYRATQNWLQEKLTAAGLADADRLMTLYGGMDSDDREAIKAAFQAHPDQSPVRILLATDAASEGIDLQNHCYRLLHFEIPWNPNRMEQRNGRIDRHGQTHDPLIFHFVAEGYAQRHTDIQALAPGELDADLEFLMRAAEKVDQIREDLGKVGPVIATQVEEAMLGKRQKLDTVMAEQDAGAVRRTLKFERDLRAQIDRHYEQLNQTKQTLALTPENIQEVVKVALGLAEQPPLRPTTLADGTPAFHLPQLGGSWADAAHGLAHPHTGDIRPIVFDPSHARRRDDVVLAHLNHRLVQMCLRLLRTEVWAPAGKRTLSRVTGRVVPNHILDTPAVIAHARLVITGGAGHRLHEQTITAGGVIRQGRFRRLNVGERRTILESATDQPVTPNMQGRLADLWDNIRPSLEQALTVRVQERVKGMERLLQEREEKELADIEAILTELRAGILSELQAINEPEYRQLSLFNDEERTQLQVNIQALRTRLEQIPHELTAEQAAIRTRYADPQPRLFPVSVTFLVPAKLNR